MFHPIILKMINTQQIKTFILSELNQLFMLLLFHLIGIFLYN